MSFASIFPEILACLLILWTLPFFFQYHFVLVQVCSIVSRQSYTFQSVPPDISSTHLTPYRVITVLLTISPVPVIPNLLGDRFCERQFSHGRGGGGFGFIQVHYFQAHRLLCRLVPNRPRLVLVCGPEVGDPCPMLYFMSPSLFCNYQFVLFFVSSPKDMLLILDRGDRREKEGERNISVREKS